MNSTTTPLSKMLSRQLLLLLLILKVMVSKILGGKANKNPSRESLLLLPTRTSIFRCIPRPSADLGLYGETARPNIKTGLNCDSHADIAKTVARLRQTYDYYIVAVVCA